MINRRHGDPQTAEPRADLVGKDEGALGAVAWIRRDPAYELQHRGDAFKGQVPEREKVRRTFAFFFGLCASDGISSCEEHRRTCSASDHPNMLELPHYWLGLLVWSDGEATC